MYAITMQNGVNAVQSFVCLCVNAGLCVCAFPFWIWIVDDDLMCQISFTPVLARDTVKLIEPNINLLKVAQNVQSVINMPHIKACVFFFSKSMCNKEKIPEQSKISVLHVCVCVIKGEKDEGGRRDHRKSAAVEVDYEVVKMLFLRETL